MKVEKENEVKKQLEVFLKGKDSPLSDQEKNHLFEIDICDNSMMFTAEIKFPIFPDCLAKFREKEIKEKGTDSGEDSVTKIYTFKTPYDSENKFNFDELKLIEIQVEGKFSMERDAEKRVKSIIDEEYLKNPDLKLLGSVEEATKFAKDEFISDKFPFNREPWYDFTKEEWLEAVKSKFIRNMLNAWHIMKYGQKMDKSMYPSEYVFPEIC